MLQGTKQLTCITQLLYKTFYFINTNILILYYRAMLHINLDNILIHWGFHDDMIILFLMVESGVVSLWIGTPHTQLCTRQACSKKILFWLLSQIVVQQNIYVMYINL